MANWHGAARTNYVRVKSEQAFRDWAETLGEVEVVEDREGRLALLELSGEGWPVWTEEDEETGEEYERSVPCELAEHLQEGSIAVLMESGAEKLRYVTGFAVAVNSSGELLEIDLNQIHDLIREAGWEGEATRAML